MDVKNKYNQLNILTIIAMIMIFCIHYFNNFRILTTNNVLKVFPIGLIFAFILSCVLYYLYKLIIRILQLEGSDYSV